MVEPQRPLQEVGVGYDSEKEDRVTCWLLLLLLGLGLICRLFDHRTFLSGMLSCVFC